MWCSLTEQMGRQRLWGVFVAFLTVVKLGEGKSCFQTECFPSGGSSQPCFSSGWQCSSDEYCSVQSGGTNGHGKGHSTGHLTMSCAHAHDGNHNLHWCENHNHHHHHSPQCHVTDWTQDCIWCCQNALCVQNLFPPTTTTATPHPPLLTSTPLPSHPTTLHPSLSTTTTTTVKAPATATTTYAVPATSRVTTLAPPAAGNSTLNPSTGSTTLANPRCVQCGDYQNYSRTCTPLELVQDTVTDCPDPLTPFCMTDLRVDTAGKLEVLKRCVTAEKCINQWYLQTSDKQSCVGFDPLAPTPGIACHYCCRGSGCNTNVVPPSHLLWRP